MTECNKQRVYWKLARQNYNHLFLTTILLFKCPFGIFFCYPLIVKFKPGNEESLLLGEINTYWSSLRTKWCNRSLLRLEIHTATAKPITHPLYNTKVRHIFSVKGLSQYFTMGNRVTNISIFDQDIIISLLDRIYPKMQIELYPIWTIVQYNTRSS